MHDAMQLSMPWWVFAVRGALVYIGLLTLLRLTGKRGLGDMSAFDIVVLVLVGGVLRTAILGDDHSFLAPVIGTVSIVATQKTIGWVSARSPHFNRLVEGWPTVLVRDGRRDPMALRKHDISDSELNRALHAAGLEDESTIAIARLEPNGKITMIRRGGGAMRGEAASDF